MLVSKGEAACVGVVIARFGVRLGKMNSQVI
jgi:hypothetical protein